MSFTANAGEDVYADKGGIVVLSAAQVGEEATYKWYNQAGDLVHEGVEFTVEVITAQKYTLEVTAASDGFKAYDEVEVKLNPSSLEDLYPNPTDGQITITYKINNTTDAANAYIVITNFNYFSYSFTEILNINENSITLDMQEYPAGMYAVSLYCDGQFIETKTFIKD
jgi:hypothetical protein